MRNGTQRKTESDVNLKLIWEQLLNSTPGPDNAQLCHLVIRSQPLAKNALQQLFKQTPTNHELYVIMRDAEIEHKNLAFEKLVQEKDIYKNLVSAIIEIPELRDVAWKKFIEMGPGGKELRQIAEFIEPLNNECWKLILTQEISNDELIHLMEINEELRNEAWDKLLQQNCTSRQLCRIIEHCPQVRKKAWDTLMQRGATNAELRYLIDHAPAIRKIAEYKLRKATAEVMEFLNGMF
jgi:hypothetical protein